MECQDAISSHEFAYWQAYDQLEPIAPNWRQLFGTLGSILLNGQRTKTSQKIFTWEDVFPDPRVGVQEQSTEEQISFVEMLNTAFGGADLRDKKTSSA